MRVQFVGCGDAFGSGGRFNTCFHVETPGGNFLIDCGASSLIGMKKLGIDRNAIDLILLTHFHPDHFGGVPFFILDAQLVAEPLHFDRVAQSVRRQIQMRVAVPDKSHDPHESDQHLVADIRKEL